MKTVAVTDPSPPDARRMNPVCRPCWNPPQVPASAYHCVLGSQATEESPSPAKHLVPSDTCAEILANEKQRHAFPGQMSPKKAFSSQRGPETGHLRSLGVNDYMKVPDSRDPLGIMRTGSP